LAVLSHLLTAWVGIFSNAACGISRLAKVQTCCTLAYSPYADRKDLAYGEKPQNCAEKKGDKACCEKVVAFPAFSVVAKCCDYHGNGGGGFGFSVQGDQSADKHIYGLGMVAFGRN